MSTLAVLLIALVAAFLLYFLSSGVAFALMYRMGDRFPNGAVGTLYEPLEWLSRRFGLFRYVYNGLHALCYRAFVGKLINGWVPPPPGIAKELQANDGDNQRP